MEEQVVLKSINVRAAKTDACNLFEVRFPSVLEACSMPPCTYIPTAHLQRPIKLRIVWVSALELSAGSHFRAEVVVVIPDIALYLSSTRLTLVRVVTFAKEPH